MKSGNKEGRKTEKENNQKNPVISIFTGKPLTSENSNPIIRIAPENDGLEMLYSNRAHPEKIYSLKIACWALRADGQVLGMIPWLNKLIPGPEINDPLDGFWQGYRDPVSNEIFYNAPLYKINELKAAAEHYCPKGAKDISEQQIPDSIGTHAALTDDGFATLTLIEVHSWKLLEDGSITGQFVDNDKSRHTPVLKGDESLKEANDHPHFRYFFQHQMANKIKNQDPEAMAAISLLIEGK